MRKKIALFAIIAVVLTPAFSMLATANKVAAASLTTVSTSLGSQNVSTATSTVITYTPVTALTAGSTIEVTYDSNFTGGAALTTADVVLTGTGATFGATTLSGAVNGYFKLTLSTITGTPTSIIITLNGTNKLTTPAANGNYSFSVSENIGGAGTTYDVGAGLAYVSSNAIKRNQVQVTAIVPPVITLDLYQTGLAAKLVDPNTCALGVLSLNQVKTCTYDVGVGTNNAAGATVKVQSTTGLTNGTYILANATGAIVAGTEAYGFAITAAGTVFTPAAPFATQYQTVPTASQTVFATSATVSNQAIIAQHFTVTHAAAIGTATQTGTNYNQIVSYFGYTN